MAAQTNPNGYKLTEIVLEFTFESGGFGFNLDGIRSIRNASLIESALEFEADLDQHEHYRYFDEYTDNRG